MQSQNTNTNTDMEDSELDTLEREYDQLESEPLPNKRVFSPHDMGMEDFGATNFELSKFLNNVNFADSKISSLFFDPNTDLFLENTAKYYALTTDQSRDLSRIVRDTLLGDIFIGDLVKKIQNGLQLNSYKAAEIVNEIISDLFAPAIQEILADQRSRFPDRVQALRSTQSKTPKTSPEIQKPQERPPLPPRSSLPTEIKGEPVKPEISRKPKVAIEELAQKYAGSPTSSQQIPSQPPTEPKKFYNPASSLDVNKNNVLDLRNKP